MSNYYNPVHDLMDAQENLKKMFSKTEDIAKATSIRESVGDHTLSSYGSGSSQVNFVQFSDSVKDKLVSLTLENMMKHIIPGYKLLTENEKSYITTLCEEYVVENKGFKLLSKFKSSNSMLLSEYANTISDYHKLIIEKCDDNHPETCKVDDSDTDSFLSDLDKVDSADVEQTIKERVSRATEEFLQNNIKDKMEIEDILATTKDKIDTIKPSGDENVAEAIKNEYVDMQKHQIQQVKSRSKNLLESMIYRTTESIMKDDLLKESFMLEDGKLDNDSIIENTQIMYTFLEMLHTTKIEEMTNERIAGILESI